MNREWWGRQRQGIAKSRDMFQLLQPQYGSSRVGRSTTHEQFIDLSDAIPTRRVDLEIRRDQKKQLRSLPGIFANEHPSQRNYTSIAHASHPDHKVLYERYAPPQINFTGDQIKKVREDIARAQRPVFMQFHKNKTERDKMTERLRKIYVKTPISRPNRRAAQRHKDEAQMNLPPTLRRPASRPSSSSSRRRTPSASSQRTSRQPESQSARSTPSGVRAPWLQAFAMAGKPKGLDPMQFIPRPPPEEPPATDRGRRPKSGRAVRSKAAAPTGKVKTRPVIPRLEIGVSTGGKKRDSVRNMRPQSARPARKVAGSPAKHTARPRPQSARVIRPWQKGKYPGVEAARKRLGLRPSAVYVPSIEKYYGSQAPPRVARPKRPQSARVKRVNAIDVPRQAPRPASASRLRATEPRRIRAEVPKSPVAQRVEELVECVDRVISPIFDEKSEVSVTSSTDFHRGFAVSPTERKKDPYKPNISVRRRRRREAEPIIADESNSTTSDAERVIDQYFRKYREPKKKEDRTMSRLASKSDSLLKKSSEHLGHSPGMQKRIEAELRSQMMTEATSEIEQPGEEKENSAPVVNGYPRSPEGPSFQRTNPSGPFQPDWHRTSRPLVLEELKDKNARLEAMVAEEKRRLMARFDNDKHPSKESSELGLMMQDPVPNSAVDRFQTVNERANEHVKFSLADDGRAYEPPSRHVAGHTNAIGTREVLDFNANNVSCKDPALATSALLLHQLAEKDRALAEMTE